MGAQLESLGAGEAGEDSIELGLEVVGEVHVGHGTTHPAREVMMMTHQRLGQFEAGELAHAGHAMHDSLGFEHGEIAVDAARTLPRRAQHDLVDGQRPPRRGEDLDQVAPGAGVPTVVVRETRRHGLVKIGSHESSITGRSEDDSRS
jgi:hypothetical protein